MSRKNTKSKDVFGIAGQVLSKNHLKKHWSFKCNMDPVASWSYFELMLWMSKHQRIGVDIVLQIFLFKTHLFILPRTLRNTYWIGDPFTQVKSAKYMVKSKTKSISSLGAFSNFSETERSICNFPKIPARNWSSSYLSCYGAWAQKESAKLQNMCVCTGKTGLSSIKLVWLIQSIGWSTDQRNLKMSAESLPLSRLI